MVLADQMQQLTEFHKIKQTHHTSIKHFDWKTATKDEVSATGKYFATEAAGAAGVGSCATSP